MLNRLGVGIGAGLASALLFSVTAKGTAAAMALAYLAPLPIMIAALGWGLEADALASVLAPVAVAVVIADRASGSYFDAASGFIFFLTIVLPAALLAALAVATRARPFDRTSAPPVRASLGTLAITAAALGAIVSGGALGTMVVTYGGYAQAVTAFREMLAPTLSEAVGGGIGLPEELGADDIARLVIRYAPAAIAASTTLMLLVNLYVAARVAQVSQRLQRPWLDIPTQFKLPLPLVGVAVVAVAGWVFLPEPYNPFVAAIAAPLALIFAFQGLAVLHAMSRPAPGRLALMCALYFSFFVAPRWVGLALAVVGLVESVAMLRTRQIAKPVQK